VQLVASEHFMRLSLKKAAHAAVSGAGTGNPGQGHGAVLPAASVTRRLSFRPWNYERGSQIVAGQSTVRPRIPGHHPPDFLSRLVALASFLRLSLRKAAHPGMSGAAWQEIRDSAQVPSFPG
jgi:hypothetical protein